jgi:CheY-like chemotaxis protein
MPQKRKKILFVDDDANLLEVLRQMMVHFSGGTWEVLTALDVSKAMSILQEQKLDLLVIDIHMPLVDGLQFLNLLQRKYPNLLKVILTGDATEQHRAACLSNGAELFLEKPRDEGGWRSVYATLHELTRFQPEEGFRGVLRRVGLPDVLQMECLARHSVVLKIQAGSVQGLIFVKDGQIIHAQCGSRSGDEAFNYLMGLAGGEFDVQAFAEPPAKTISGSWEFLLMDAARKHDEEGQSTPTGHSDSGFSAPMPVPLAERNTPAVLPILDVALPAPGETDRVKPVEERSDAGRPQVEEMLVCSLQGEVLHEWQCTNTNGRVGFLEFLSQKARQLGQGLPLGDFDRLEVNSPSGRVVAQIQSDRALFVRTSRVSSAASSDTVRP